MLPWDLGYGPGHPPSPKGYGWYQEYSDRLLDLNVADRVTLCMYYLDHLRWQLIADRNERPKPHTIIRRFLFLSIEMIKM